VQTAKVHLDAPGALSGVVSPDFAKQIDLAPSDKCAHQRLHILQAYSIIPGAMGLLESVCRRIGLITIPRREHVTLTCDTLDEHDIIVPQRCSGDPAHDGIAAEKPIRGKHVRVREVEAVEKEGTPSYAARVLFFIFGFIFMTRPQSSGRRRLAFDHLAPYCARCYQGIRKTQTIRSIATLLLILSSLLCCPLASIVESSWPGVGSSVFLVTLGLGFVLFVILLLSGLVLRRSETIRIVDFASEGNATRVVLAFSSQDYANLFLLENSLRALSDDPRPKAREEAIRRLGQLDNPIAIEALTRLLQKDDESPEIVACAKEALESVREIKRER
jgi:hypothetical protein